MVDDNIKSLLGMFKTATELNFDTVLAATKVIMKILFSLSLNDNVVYDPSSIVFSSCSYIPTEYSGESV